MSDEQLPDEVDSQETAEAVEIEDEQEQAEPEQQDSGYRESLPDGYMDLEEWEAAGKPRDEWMSPKAFNDIGRFTQATNRLNQKFDHAQQKHAEEIANLKTYQLAQLQNKEKEIIARYNEAVEMGDIDEANKVSNEYWDNKNQLNVAQRPAYNPQAEAKVQELETWYSGLTQSHSGMEVDMAIQTAMQRNQTANGVDVDRVMSEVNGFFQKNQPSNPKRQSPPTVATSNRRTSTKISMKDCTEEELAQRPFFKDDKAFLNAVKTVRSQA